MGDTADDFVRQGIGVVKTGDRANAANLFEQAIQLDQNNQAAWLWLSGCVEDKEKKRACLERVSSIDPTTDAAKRAQEGLAHLPSAPPPSALSALLDGSPATQGGANDGADGQASPATHDTLVLPEQTRPVNNHNLADTRVDFSDNIGHSSKYNLGQRLKGVITFKAPVYREIAERSDATIPAAVILVVVGLVVSVPWSVVSLLLAASLTLTSVLITLVSSVIVTPLVMLVMWWLSSWLLAFVANKFFQGSATTVMIQRVQGHVAIFNLLLLIPVLGFLAALPLALIGATIGVREAARIETTRAVLTLLIVFLIGVLFSCIGGVLWYGLSLVV